MESKDFSSQLSDLRSQFPILNHWLYLNHAGVCPISKKVIEGIDAYLRDLAENGVAHEEKWEEMADRVRAQFARLVNCDPLEVTFIRNTSHGLSLFASGYPWKEGDNVVLCEDEEYPSVIYPWKQLKSRGVSIRKVKATEDHRIPISAFLEAIDKKTRALCVSSVEYATGFRNDLASLGQIAHERGIYLIVDGIQSLGALKMDVQKYGIHLLAADSHKWLLGISGIGGCYIHKDLIPLLTPPLVGWKSTKGAWDFDRARYDLWDDARRFEEGSPNYAGIYGFHESLKIFEIFGMEWIESRLFALTDFLIEGLQRLNHPVTFVSSLHPKERSSFFSFQLPGFGEELASILQEQKVCISYRRKAFRISPHFYNTEDELNRFLEILKESILKLQGS
ncbi:MAG: aminotransferase class V-fold PLP-dependent enzyme [Planctomycetota bacterium]|nr:MAG: aminotransferase class V-fold PLP-dependent enzyme [Planctomycetota bacterium]